jgi:hypothetical protein
MCADAVLGAADVSEETGHAHPDYHYDEVASRLSVKGGGEEGMFWAKLSGCSAMKP